MRAVDQGGARGPATTCMSGSTFVDTNVLVYAVDETDPEKRDVAREVLGSNRYGTFVLSAQILGEFYVTVTRRLAEPMSEAQAAEAVDWLSLRSSVSIDTALVKSAVEISCSTQLSYWDGLVVAAATRAGCECLLTEDLNDGQEIGSVRIENPFRDVP